MMRKTLIIILLAFIPVFSACKEDVALYYYPEKMAEYLQLSENQHETVMPKLNGIRDEIFGFFKEWGSKFRNSRNLDSKEERRKYRKEQKTAVEKITGIVKEAAEFLDDKQKKKLVEVQFPELYFQEAMTVLMESRREEGKKEVPVKKVYATVTERDLPKELPDLSKLIEHWTVTFGARTRTSRGFGLGMGGGGGQGRISNFPLKIKATLLDPLILVTQKIENEKNYDIYPASVKPILDDMQMDILKIDVSITTSFHDSYLDLKNWIIYIENDDMEQFELWKTEKREKPENDRPSLPFFQRDINNPEEYHGHGEMNLGRMFGETRKSAHFTLYFKSRTQEKFLITKETEYIKLVFLKEVGTNETSVGMWAFSRKIPIVTKQ